jgi:hypothetical protein
MGCGLNCRRCFSGLKSIHILSCSSEMTAWFNQVRILFPRRCLTYGPAMSALQMQAALHVLSHGKNLCPQIEAHRERGSNLGVGGNQKQTVDQGGLRFAGVFQKFRDFQFVEAVMPGSPPFVSHQQTPGFGIEHQTPRVLVRRRGSAPGLVKLSIDSRHVGSFGISFEPAECG